MGGAGKEGVLFFTPPLVYFAHFMNRALGKLFLGWVGCGVAGQVLLHSTTMIFLFFFFLGVACGWGNLGVNVAGSLTGCKLACPGFYTK